jgi:hypothetical protein
MLDELAPSEQLGCVRVPWGPWSKMPNEALVAHIERKLGRRNIPPAIAEVMRRLVASGPRLRFVFRHTVRGRRARGHRASRRRGGSRASPDRPRPEADPALDVVDAPLDPRGVE